MKKVTFLELVSEYLLLAEAARQAEVHRSTVWRWIKQGKLQAYRIGREVLIEKAEIDKLRR